MSLRKQGNGCPKLQSQAIGKYNSAPNALAQNITSPAIENIIHYAGADDCVKSAKEWRDLLVEKAEEVRRQRAANAVAGIVSAELESLLVCETCGGAGVNELGRIVCGLACQSETQS